MIGDDFRATSYGEFRDNCIIGNNASFGSRCTLSAGTVVGNDVVVKYAFVATDTPDLTKKEKSTCVLEDGSLYGAMVVVMPGVRVGKKAIIGACSQIRKDVLDGEVWFGNPAQKYK